MGKMGVFGQLGTQLSRVRCGRKECTSLAKRRLPIVTWVPRYKKSWILQDLLAGLTVGLTAIPQGIAYGVVAKLSPEYGLYSAFMASFIYIIFGSCPNITVGPTAIMALMVQPLVLKLGADMAVLICFLKGCVIALLGIFHLGFLLDFVSVPVITGFTMAAALNIASSQFAPIFGITGNGDGFLNCIIYFFANITEVTLWNSILGIATAAILVLLKNLPAKRSGTMREKIFWGIGLARNAFVVVFGTIMAYIFHIYGINPFKLTGSLGRGIPPFGPPPFSTTYQNKTYDFQEMTMEMGSTLFTIPVISTIEHMAIAKAFAKGKSLDATQEMLALGLCNIFGSFVRSMPVTGSFTRTAVNHASGVRTTLGGLFTGLLVLLASGLLTSTFQYIPKATLAAVIITAMYYMLDFKTCILLWHARKIDFLVMLITLLVCLFLGLEVGIIVGITTDLILLLYFSAVPSVETSMLQVGGRTVVYIIPEEAVSFPAAERLRSNVMKLSEESLCNVILDCKNLKRIDVTVAKNFKLLSEDLSARGQDMIVVNCNSSINDVLKSMAPNLQKEFDKDDAPVQVF